MDSKDFKGAPGVSAPGNAGTTSDRLGSATGQNDLTAHDGRTLCTLLTDFHIECNGDQGKRAGITIADKQWLGGIIGKLKGMVDQLVYGAAV